MLTSILMGIVPNPEQEFRFIYLYRRQIPLIKEVFYFMRKKLNKKRVLWIVFGILCLALILGLILKPKASVSQSDLSSNIQTEDVGTKKEQDISSTDTRSTGEVPVTLSVNSDVSVNNNDESKSAEETESTGETATFKVGDTEFKILVSENTTVYDTMNTLMSEGKIAFEGKEYPALGFFVTKINALQSGGGKNLMYDINGKEASFGVSSYVVQEGDIIEWKLK